jgi:phosphatidylglycerophosphate synthase
LSSALARSRKTKVAQELLCEHLFRPLAHLVVMVLLPVRVPPPLVAAASGATGIAAAVELAQGRFLLAALLVQLKTVLDNADGQLARLSGRITAFGRYLDSELDLVVNAALFAAVGWSTGRPALAAAGFVALTTVLNVNYNAERLYRTERGEPASAMPETTGRAAGLLRRLYLLVYAPQDRLVERFVASRLSGAGPQARLAYHDRPPSPYLRTSACRRNSWLSVSASRSGSQARSPGSRSPNSRSFCSSPCVASSRSAASYT